MAAPSVDNANLKIDRAEEHLEAVEQEIRIFHESKPCTIVPKKHPKTGHYKFQITVPAVPRRAGIIVGDFTTCLRASLDHLAWQLALLKTPSPDGRTCFPIYGAIQKDTRAKFRRSVKDIPTQAASIIESLQPYHRGDSFRDDPLWKVHKLCNIDKHREIPTWGTIADVKVLIPKGAQTRTIDDGNVVVAIPEGVDVEPYMKMEPQSTLDVFFGNTSVGIQLTVQDLRSIHKFIRDEVIPRFAGFFP